MDGDAARRSLEVAALLRMNLGATLAESRAIPASGPLLDALVAAGALRRGQAIAVAAYVDKHRVACRCGHITLAPEGTGIFFACPGCGSAIARVSSEGGKPSPPRVEALPGEGQRVGPLVLEKLLGKGAFGSVYRARHAELGRVSAVKLIPGGALDATRKKRFEREVVAQARLDHPGIVKIHATYELGSTLACEMDFVEGGTLRGRLEREGALGWREAATLISKVARAIEHAHERGVVHRDLKPENILLRADTGEPVVADLGLARFLDQASSLTREGATLGTPLYMSPEAVAGTAGASPGVDVWALGVLLHECTTGEPPYDAESVIELFAAIACGNVRPLAGPDIPADLGSVRSRAMSVELSARYARARDLADDLERVLAGAPLGKAPRGRLVRPRVAAAIVACGAIAAAAALSMGKIERSDEDPCAAEPALSPETRSRDLLREAESIVAKNPARARALARSASQLAGQDGDAVDLLVRLGDGDGALAAIAKVPESRRDEPDVRLLHARALRALGRRDEALAALGSPRDPKGAFFRAALLTEASRIDEAIKAVAPWSGDKIDPSIRAEALVAEGRAHLAAYRAADLETHALWRAKEASGAERFDAIAVNELAAAALAFNKARGYVGGQTDVLLGQGECLLELGAIGDAITIFNQAAPGARDRRVFLLQAAGHVRDGRIGEMNLSLEMARSAPEEIPAYLDGRELSADVARQEARGRVALRVLRDARRAVYAAGLSRSPAEGELAERLCNCAAFHFPHSASAQTSVGICYFLKGDRRAIDCADRALAIQPDEVARTIKVLARTREGCWDDPDLPSSEIEAKDPERDASGLRPVLLRDDRLLRLKISFAMTRGDARRLPALLDRLRAIPKPDLYEARRTNDVLEKGYRLLGRIEDAKQIESWRRDALGLPNRDAILIDDLKSAEEAVVRDPTDALARIRRGELLHERFGSDPRAFHDLVTASMMDPSYGLAPLLLVFSSTGARAARIRSVMGEASESALAGDHPTPGERAAAPLALAIMDLRAARSLDHDLDRARALLIRALRRADRADDLCCENPATHGVRALALSRLLPGTPAGPRCVDLVRDRADDAFSIGAISIEVLRKLYASEPVAASDIAPIDSARGTLVALAPVASLHDFHGWERVIELAGGTPTAACVVFDHPAEVELAPPGVLEGTREDRGGEIVIRSSGDRSIAFRLSDYPTEVELVLEPGVTSVTTESDWGSKTYRVSSSATRQLRTFALVPFRSRPLARVRADGDFCLIRWICRAKPEPEVLAFRTRAIANVRAGFGLCFGEQPDARHLAALDASMKTDRPAGEGVAEWLGSDGFWDDCGGHLPTYVLNVHRVLLGREPTADEQAVWEKRLAEGKADRSFFTHALRRTREGWQRFR